MTVARSAESVHAVVKAYDVRGVVGEQIDAAFVRQQIGQRLAPAIQQIMQQRGATIALDRGATLAINPSVDITDAVLAVVNQNTAAINVNAPPPQAPAAQPQQQRPQGR